MDETNYIDWLEWEPISRGAQFDIEEDGAVIGTATVQRDDQYDLTADVRIAPQKAKEWSDHNILPGTFIQPIVLQGEAQASPARYTLRGSPRLVTVVGIPETQAEAAFAVFEVQRAFSPTPASLVADWFISGPESPPFWLFGRTTRRTQAATFKRERMLTQDDAPVSGFSNTVRHQESHARDYFQLSVLGVDCRVCQVSDKQGPSWTKKLTIETDATSVMAEDTNRTALAEALGFLFGRQLLPVGTTWFAADGWPVRDVAICPWGSDVVSFCRQPDLPPVDIREEKEAESLAGQIVAAYMDKRDTLALKDVMWSSWIARRLPAGVALPVFASALETLMTAWFASEKSKSQALFMPRKDFETFFGDVLEAFRTKCAALPEHGQRIADKLQKLPEMGGTAKFRAFFAEIGLQLGAKELAAFAARHTFAHGTSHDASVEDIVRHGDVYRTMVNRALLRTLGLEFGYIDYSTPGHPTRNLVDPQGG